MVDRKNKISFSNGVNVDVVENYKYLGVHIDNKLDWVRKLQNILENTAQLLHQLVVQHRSVWNKRLGAPTSPQTPHKVFPSCGN